jgi:hypothetical protein
VIPIRYDLASTFKEGLCAVALGNSSDGYTWSYIDMTGADAFSAHYENATDFENGRAEVVLKGDTFFIDKKGNIIP